MEGIFQILVIVALLIAYWYKKFRDFEQQSAHIPGKPIVPFFGHGLLFANKTPAQMLKMGTEMIKESKGLIRNLLGFQLQIYVADPKIIEELVSSPVYLDKSDEYKFLYDWLGTGLLVSTGQKWSSRRKFLTPAFHFAILEQFVEIFDKHAMTFVGKLKEFGDQEVDVFPLTRMLTMDIICEAAMGVKIDAQNDSESKYVKAIKE